jgi:hypothetical protein
MPFQVLDRKGGLIELEDDEPVPHGCTVRVPMHLMDDAQSDDSRLHPWAQSSHGISYCLGPVVDHCLVMTVMAAESTTVAK